MQNFKIFGDYLDSLKREVVHGKGRELTYRHALKQLFEQLDDSIIAINEAARVSVGAPDFVIEKATDYRLRQAKLFASPPLALVEVKDLGKDLDDPKNQEQLNRYFEYCGNIIHTDYLQFRFYINKRLITTIQLIEVQDDNLIIDSAQYSAFELAFKNLLGTGITVKSAENLANLMAERARAIKDVIYKALHQDIDNDSDSEIASQFRAFKNELVSDLTHEKFADLYAQTLTYGLFAARYHDKTLETFSLKEAAEILPPTNPFLQKFFREIAGYEREERINWVLDGLVDVFNRCNVRELLRNDPKKPRQHDPIIHFYETFLDRYNPALRRKMGVYYTPLPIVDYIIRRVDEVLKNEFNLADGLADETPVEVEIKGHQNTKTDYKRGYSIGKKSIPKVQVLDPALGTGTFLNETFKQIASTKKKQLGSGWSKYVESSLLKRIHGFELMMAPYAMSHLRLNLTLAESGYKPLSRDPQRLGVYLTNTLAEPHEGASEQVKLNLTGLDKLIASESRQADEIKANTPVMVVLGNPPYSIHSSNPSIDEDGKLTFIGRLLADYKKDLNERKINLDDDYIKFIRFSEAMIARNGSGVLAMITNNSYIDGVTHRQMRKHLLETFDKIYILDLHGNSTKGEAAPDGGKDENVFNIQQGVAIMVMIKTSNNKVLGKIHHAELYGTQVGKFEELNSRVNFSQLPAEAPYYFFTPQNSDGRKEYESFISINELFVNKSSGFRSGADGAQICWNKNQIERVVEDLINLPEEEFRSKYKLKDGRNHNYAGMKKDVGEKVEEDRIITTLYRPFDIRFTYYSKRSSGFVARPRNQTMRNFLNGSTNIGLIYKRGYIEPKAAPVGITDRISGERTWSRPGMQGADTVAPLYIYHDDGTRDANFDQKLLAKFTKNLTTSYQPEDVLGYIYAVLHSPTYRQKYKEFLKIDFPRVPAPVSEAEFRRLAELGASLRELHLMKTPKLASASYSPSGDGNWLVEKLTYAPTSETIGNVYVNNDQHFANVPKAAWDFYTGGYQPAQKWLKDRKGRELSSKDLIHYQQIIKVLMETDRIMKEIDG
jgi:predicted helicase